MEAAAVDQQTEPAIESSKKMPPQSSDERQNVVVIDKHLTFAIISLIAIIFMVLLVLCHGLIELYKIDVYKQGTCILTEATVDSITHRRSSRWMARWTVLLNNSNSSLIRTKFSESIGDAGDKKSTALAYIALRQVNTTYPCFYDGQISPNSFNKDAEFVQWKKPTKEDAQMFFDIGLLFIALSVVPSLYILWRFRFKICTKRRSDI